MNKIIEEALSRKGFTHSWDLAIHISIIEFLQKNGHFQNSMEIGYFNGRTSKIPLSFNPKKHFIIEQFWDVYNYGQKEDRENPCVDVWANVSQKLPLSKINELLYNVDFMLIDGEHTKDGLLGDLDLAYKVLSKYGILVVDDVSLEFPIHIEALNSFCKEHELLKLFQTDTQAFYCRPQFFEDYYKYFLTEMPRRVVELLGDDLDGGFKILSGTYANDYTCFLSAPFFTMLRTFGDTPKLQYVGEANYKIEYPNTFPIVERKDLRYLNIE